MTFAERLRQLRTEKGMSLEDVGQIIGVGRASIYKYEHGVVINIPEDKLTRLARFFGVSNSYLKGYSDDRKVDLDEYEDRAYTQKELNVINGLAKCIVGNVCGECTYDGTEGCVDQLMRDALDIINVKKPIRPKKYPPTRYSDTTFGCRVCGSELSPGKPKFCHECGHPIKWEE